MADTFRGIITADGKKRQLPYRNIIESVVSDETLSIQGAFADAKVVDHTNLFRPSPCRILSTQSL